MRNLIQAVSGAVLLVGLALGPAFAVQEDPALTTSIPSNAVAISAYYNEDVYDTQNNQIGDVNDILLGQDGRVEAVMVGVGGFLGVGEKDVAVPFNALKVTEKDGDRYLVMDTTKQALESAPGYIFDREKNQWVPSKKQPS